MKWEYSCTFTALMPRKNVKAMFASPKGWVEKMNIQGASGWEAFAAIPQDGGCWVLFKKPVAD